MENGGLNAKGIFMRFGFSLVLVYATFNPEGLSFFDWAVKPLFQGDLALARAQAPLKVLVALVLIGLWTFFLRTTRRSIGWVGGLLVLGIAAVIGWLLIDWHLVRPSSSRAITHLGLFALAIVLTIGMSWSHISRRLSGQVDTDDTK
jgi:hypothetical protein